MSYRIEEVIRGRSDSQTDRQESEDDVRVSQSTDDR